MPAKLEELDTGTSPATPLVLIHDGGGTIFQYCMLGPFERDTYAIANPYFHDGTRPADGITDLAKEYIQAIRTTLHKGPLILGGWSLGGAISLEISRLLRDDTDLKVTGILMIDTYCPWRKYDGPRVRHKPTFLETTSEEMKAKVRQAFEHAGDMLAELPRPEGFTPPPAIMIRAADATAVDGSRLENDRLGWSAFPELDITYTVDVPGDHFSMFKEDRLDNITHEIQKACISFERSR